MLEKTLFLIIFILALSFSALAQNTSVLPTPKPAPKPSPQDLPPGNMGLLDGYTHFQGGGIDSITGQISKPNGMIIRYDNGSMSGWIARSCLVKDRCLWYKVQKINGTEVNLGMTKEGKILATFPKEYANFFAQTKSPEDIADFLIMVLTYKVKEPKVPNKTETQKPKQQ